MDESKTLIKNFKGAFDKSEISTDGISSTKDYAGAVTDYNLMKIEDKEKRARRNARKNLS